MTLISRTTSQQYDAAASAPVASRDAPTSETVARAVRRVIEEAARADGRSPLDEATLLSLRHHGLDGKDLWVARDDAGQVVGFALLSTPADRAAAAELSLVVAPAARRQGVGRALAQEALRGCADRPVTAWSHGHHPAAARLAGSWGFDRVRDLWLMRRPLSPAHPLPPVVPAGGTVVRPFRVGEDEEAFLAINAEAFVDHPEQGAMTRADLDERMAEPWFDPEGFFVAEPADAPPNAANEMVDSPSLLGFHWTKVHHDDPPFGEVYVVGISPVAQGRGLGKALTLAGLHHLRDRGLAEVVLYVEADNAPAIAVYAGLGFTHADEDTDVMYQRPAGARAED